MKIPFIKQKPAILCIHGFGLRLDAEFDSLKKALEKKGFHVEVPTLYNLNDPDDIKWQSWLRKAESALIQLSSEYKQVIIIGFSMGGVIASFLSNHPSVEKVILLSPAYDYMSVDNVINYLMRPFQKPDKVSPLDPYKDTFRDVVDHCKESVSSIKKPILVMHCADDEVIPMSSSTKMIKKIPSTHKLLITFSGGQHRILDDPLVSKVAINNIQTFISEDLL